MAKSKLSSAYKAAASAGGKYQASLYDVENIGHQREASAQLAGIKAQDMSRTVGMISEGLDLAGNVIRRGQRREETEKAATALGAEKVGERTLWDKLTGKEQMWEKGGAEVSGSDIMAEFKLQQQEQAFGRDRDTGKVKETETKESPVIPEVKEEKKEPTLAEESGIIQGPTQEGPPIGSAEPLIQGPTPSGKTLDMPQTSQSEIDKFKKSKAGIKLDKELSQLFDDDFNNYGFGN